MRKQTNVRTWMCKRDSNNPSAPFCATLLIDDEPIASGRGVDEVSAYAALVEALSVKGIVDGSVLGMQVLMRR
jgi:hypothetical protein